MVDEYEALIKPPAPGSWASSATEDAGAANGSSSASDGRAAKLKAES